MVNRSLALALVVIFLITTAGAALLAFYAYQQPLERVETTTVASYKQTGAYSYVAELFPNIIYNTSTLGPGQGKLFEPILSNVSITFNYTFTGTPAPTNLTETHYVQAELSSPKWTKPLSQEEAMDWLSLNLSELDFSIFINVSMVREIFKTIDLETASSSNEYNITVAPHIFQRATIEGRDIYQVFSPKVSIMFRQDQGKYVDITPLNVIREGSITDSVTIKNTSVETLRTASLIGAIASGAALVVSLALYFRSRPPEEKKPIEKIISPHKEMIVDTSQVPPVTKAVVETSSLEDLARTAELLARPIMHSVIGNEHIFFILDGETKYQFKILS